MAALGASLAVRAATAPISDDYVLRVWEAEDGLPHSSAFGIAQTPDGYLWLAGGGGLTRFDGVRFVSFSKKETGLESVDVRTVAMDRSGTLWLGLQYGGVARMRGNRFETIVPVGSPAEETAWTSSIAEDAQGAMWFGRAPQMMAIRWEGGRATEFSARDGIGPGTDTFVHADISGQMWINTRVACGVFDGTRFQPIDPTGGDNARLAPARRGGMWVVRGQRLAHYFSNGAVEAVADLTWLGGAQEVTALFESRTGDLWLGTRAAGLWRFREGTFVQVPTSRQTVLTLAEDREGNLWVGLLGGGLNRLRPQRFQLRDTRHGLAKEGVLSLVKDTEDRIWLGVRDSAPTRAIDAANQLFSDLSPWPGLLQTTLCADPEGGVWIGQHAGALLRWKDGQFTKTAFEGSIASLLRDRSGNLWIATERDGLIRWRDDAAHLEPTDAGLKRPRALAEDSAGTIWAGTEDGLVFRREDGRFVPVVLPDVRPGDSIRFIVPDGVETVWIGTRRGVLLRCQGGRIESVPADSGIGGSDLRALLIDASGDFWMARGRGLLRTTRESLAEVLAGRQRTIRGVVYDRDDGLPSGGFTFGRRNSTARTNDGRLWFATDRGCLVIDPRDQAESAPLLPVMIEEVRVRGEAVALSRRAALQIPPQPGPIEIRYTLPLLKAPDRLHFRYRLVGLEDAWVDAQNQRTASFAHLPPGRYRFEVAAKETDAPESAEVMAALPFTIRAAWWETVWFRGSMSVLGALALAALVRQIVLRRVRARMRMLEQQHALEKERTRIARDMHDDLGASLTQITLASQLARLSPPAEAAGHIDEIAAIARRTVAALDEIVWMVNPRNDTLPAALEYLGQHAVDFLSAAGIGCELEIPDELPLRPLATHARHHLFLVVKETLNNVVKHAGASTVQLKAEVDEKLLRITIADDGSGFAMGHERAGSDGLHNMSARLAELGGTCRIESQPGAGTRVIFEMPLPPEG